MDRSAITAATSGHADKDTRWLRRLERLFPGRRAAVAGQLVLGQRNIFILPSRAGAGHVGVVLLMLVVSANFGIALGYALTFLLGSLALVGMMHTFRNLARITLQPGRADPVFAGDMAELRVTVRNGSALERRAIALVAPGNASTQYVDLPAQGQCQVTLPVQTQQRGWLEAPRLLVQTRFPLGIFRAWAWWRPAMRVLVYPQPEESGIPFPPGAGKGSEQDGLAGEDDDLASLRAWLPGDPPRRIAWKAMARSSGDEILVKQFEAGASGELVFDYGALPGSLGQEARLSRLVRWVIDADQAGRRYALRLGGRTFGPDAGPAHRAECLEALALHGLHDTRR